uniref:Uncharacterized protein n=1 Tax=Panagrolaimus superbus TaxID=310955 RepID=A0A914YDZ2_9BILA
MVAQEYKKEIEPKLKQYECWDDSASDFANVDYFNVTPEGRLYENHDVFTKEFSKWIQIQRAFKNLERTKQNSMETRRNKIRASFQRDMFKEGGAKDKSNSSLIESICSLGENCSLCHIKMSSTFYALQREEKYAHSALFIFSIALLSNYTCPSLKKPIFSFYKKFLKSDGLSFDVSIFRKSGLNEYADQILVTSGNSSCDNSFAAVITPKILPLIKPTIDAAQSNKSASKNEPINGNAEGISSLLKRKMDVEESTVTAKQIKTTEVLDN